MQLVIQYPIADVRSFLTDDTGELPIVPNFVRLDPGYEFVRGFGDVSEKLEREVGGWPNETKYASGKRGVRFEEGLGTVVPHEPSTHPGWQVAHRRLFGDGQAVSRFEVALQPRHLPWDNVEAYIDSALAIPVHTPASPVRHSVTLANCHQRVAKQYRASTTRQKHSYQYKAPQWWCQPLGTAIFVEVDSGFEVSTQATVVTMEADGIEIFHWREMDQRSNRDVWVVRHEGAPQALLRKVRIHLLRMHAEWEVLRAVLNDIARGDRIVAPQDANPGTQKPHSDALQQYLLDRASLLTRRRDLDRGELFDAAYGLDAAIRSDRIQELEDALKGVRGNVLRNIVAFAQRDFAVRMLFLAANPRGTPPLRIGVEQTRIWNTLYRSLGDSYKIWPAFGVTATSLHGLIDEHPWDVVHFSGHGDNAGALVLEQEGGGPHRVDPAAVGEMFRLNSNPVRLVVLNACATGATARAIRPNVDVVVGTTKAVDDPTAVLFSESFYDNLAQGKNVQWAYERACNLCTLEGRPDVTMLLTADGVDASKVIIPRPNGAPDVHCRSGTN